jgi:predicted RNA-binding Zn-ribbon protein involved in translation (DUF1610 family)
VSGLPDLSGLKDWFAESELGTCSSCGARAVPSEAAFAVCLQCGEVALRSGEVVQD